MNNKIDWCVRLRYLASGELTGEIPSIEYALAADEIGRLRADNAQLQYALEQSEEVAGSAGMIIHTELNLLPCANCGGVPELHNQSKNINGGFYIECENPLCRMATPLRFARMDDVKPLLAEIWNRRSNALVTGAQDEL